MNRQRFINLITVGTLVIAAVSACLAKAAPAAATPSPAGKVFATLDTDHDGNVSPREFETGYAGLQRAIALGVRLREQFTAMDADKSDTLDAREYASLLLVKQAGAAAPPLSAFDTDRNNTIGFAEYVALVQALAPKPAPAPAARTP